MTPELATALVAFALIVALAVVIRHLRDRAEQRRRRSEWTGWIDPTAAAAAAELVDPAPDGHRAASAPTRIVVAGAHPAAQHAPPTVEDEPPRIQLIRDARELGVPVWFTRQVHFPDDAGRARRRLPSHLEYFP